MKKGSSSEGGVEIFWFLLVVSILLLGVHSCLPNPKQAPTNPKQTNVYILKSKTGNEIPVSVSKEIDKRLTDLSVAGDLEGINRMIKAGLVFTVPDGTEVFVIDRGLFFSEIKIQNGSFAGKYGWVFSDWLTR